MIIKRRLLILIAGLMLFLVSCDISEIEPDPVVKDPEVKINYTGKLNQWYLNETSELTDVIFSIEYLHFIENNLNVEDAEVIWVRNDANIYGEGNEFIVTPPRIASTTTVKAIIKIGDLEFVTDELLVRVETPFVDININLANTNTNDVSIAVGRDETTLTFTASITGTTDIDKLNWIITTLDEQGNELSNQVEVVTITNEDDDVITFTYDFLNYGYYRVEANYENFTSNYYFITVNYGDFVIINGEDNVYFSDSDDLSPVELLVPALTIDGTYQWILNGVELTGEVNETITHDTFMQGQYIYQVKFIPSDDNEPTLFSEPIILVYGIGVGNEVELLNALDNNEPAIILTDDILYSQRTESNALKSLVIDYPVAIAGNGHTLSSLGPQTFIQVTSNNVSFYDITIAVSGRYNVHLINVEDIYFEDVTFKEPAAGGSIIDPGAGVFIQRSKALLKNVRIVDSSNSGVRLEHGMRDGEGNLLYPASVTIIGDFIYNVDQLAFPVVSVGSALDEVEIVGTGFSTFVLPLAGGQLIRRWSRDDKPIGWNLYAPRKTQYIQGEVLTVSGISLSVSILNTHQFFGLEFVRLFLDMFDQHGEVNITNLTGDEVLLTYYVKSYDIDRRPPAGSGISENDFDNLNYYNNIHDLESMEPVLDLEPGQYLVNITIGGQLDLGVFLIEIIEEV